MERVGEGCGWVYDKLQVIIPIIAGCRSYDSEGSIPISCHLRQSFPLAYLHCL